MMALVPLLCELVLPPPSAQALVPLLCELLLPPTSAQASLRVLHEEDLAAALHNFVEKDEKVCIGGSVYPG